MSGRKDKRSRGWAGRGEDVVMGSLALDLRGVSVRRGGRTLLSNISLAVPRGETCAVIGANGSGKSTLLRVIQGFEFATRGTIRVLGQMLGETELAKLRRRVRLVGSAGGLDFDGGMTLERVVLTGAEGSMGSHVEGGVSRVREARRALAAVGLARRAEVLWQHASAGERTRGLLARARMRAVGVTFGVTLPGQHGRDDRWTRGSEGGSARPELLLLDEPTANLDPAARESVVAMLAAPARGVTQVIVTHHVEELPETTSLALVLRAGRSIALGRPKDVLTSQILSAAFGVAMDVKRHGGRFAARVHEGSRSAPVPPRPPR